MIFCQACGLKFPVPDGYSRAKIQCPDCGSICAVPADAPRGGPAPKSSPKKPTDDVTDALFDDDRPESVPVAEAAPAPRPKAKPESAPAPKPAPGPVLRCRKCGERIAAPRSCPVCDRIDADEPLPVDPDDAPVKKKPAPAAAAPKSLSLSLDEPDPADGEPLALVTEAVEDDEDDDTPYGMDKAILTCPKCKDTLKDDARVCTGCGYDLVRKKKVARTYEPINRTWDTDLDLKTRTIWMGAYLAFHFVLGSMVVVGAGGTAGAFLGFILSGLLMGGMLALILGTFARVTITRDRKGRCKVAEQWFTAFVPVPPKTTDVRGFEGVTTGPWMDVNFWDWLIFASLLIMAIVPGIVFYVLVMNRPMFHAALAQDHGRAEVYVYRGRDAGQMNDIADTLAGASGLRRLA